MIPHGTELNGEMTRGDEPEWEPLLRIVGEDGFWHQYRLDHWISYDDGPDADDRPADG